jgi:hypothetical protein
MMSSAAPPARLITRWASRASAEPLALSPEQARLDRRSFTELLAEAAHLAGLVAFHESDTLAGGDWRKVLVADPTITLALLATVDVEGHSEGLQTLLEAARRSATHEEAEELLGRLLDGLMHFAAEIDEWLEPAEAGAGLESDGAQRMIEAAIEQVLAPQLRGLLSEVAAAAETGLLRNLLLRHRGRRLRPQWRLDSIIAAGEATAVREAIERVWIDRLLDRLARVASSFVYEVREISARSTAALETSLESRRHPPHVALVMAFAKVFRHAQNRLNDVPQRIARFYHEEVLREVPREAAPDSVFLALVPKSGARAQARVPKGAIFPAGKDDSGLPISFAADSSLEITEASLAQLRLWSPRRAADGRIKRVDAELFAAAPGDASGMLAPAFSEAIVPTAVIASPALALPGGTRRIELILACAELPEALTPALLDASLTVAVSTAAGWIDLAESGIALAWERAGTSISFSGVLPPEFPGIEACPAGTSDAPSKPALRLALDQNAGSATARPWAMLGKAVVTDASLWIAVKDSPGVVVTGQSSGATSAGAAPFGSPPRAGGTLRVDHPAFASAPLDRLVLHFDWSALPPGPNGFAGHYREYLIDDQRQIHFRSPFDNAAFTATIQAPVPGWDGSRRIPLFATADRDQEPATAPPPPDVFAAGDGFAVSAPEPEPDGRLASTSWFAAAASGGGEGPLADHVEVRLAEPAAGFGDDLYSANVAYATKLLAEAEAPPPRLGLLRRLLRAILMLPMWLLGKLELTASHELEQLGPTLRLAVIPNPPFHPLLSRVRMDYGLSVPGRSLSLYHVPAFEELREAAGIAGSPLFAPLPDQLTVDLALAGAHAGETQSLLIRLGAPHDGGGGPVSTPVWQYRARDDWRPLPPQALLNDGTEGLCTTGIVRIRMPKDAADEKSVLWLRVVLPEGAPRPSILAVAPNALSATRVVEPGAAVAPIPPGTIARLSNMPGVARAVQPLASAGGRSADDPSLLRRRSVERVRHRARGVTAWDMERLVLSEFAGIAKIRVLTADPGRRGPAGETVIVVIPAPGGPDAMDPSRPRASPQRRAAIAARLKEVTSPFAGIRVVDPVYVPLDVTAHLTIRGHDAEAATAALAELLSPWAEPGLDLDDLAGGDRLRAAIAAFLLSLPDVVEIDRLRVSLRSVNSPAPWRVPVAGQLEIVGISAGRAVAW